VADTAEGAIGQNYCGSGLVSLLNAFDGYDLGPLLESVAYLNFISLDFDVHC
jgi:hypothetical protein